MTRSSMAEYLTFIATSGQGDSSLEMRCQDENLWSTQKMMATLYDVSVSAVSQHLKRIYAYNELQAEATIKPYLIVQAEGEFEKYRIFQDRLFESDFDRLWPPSSSRPFCALAQNGLPQTDQPAHTIVRTSSIWSATCSVMGRKHHSRQCTQFRAIAQRQFATTSSPNPRSSIAISDVNFPPGDRLIAAPSGFPLANRPALRSTGA